MNNQEKLVALKAHLRNSGIEYWENVQYVGNFKEGLPEGTGIYTAKDGSTYEGNFVKGKLNGEVNITDSSGKKSVGKWENGKRVS